MTGEEAAADNANMRPYTVTVVKRYERFFSSYSQIPGREFGPYDISEMIRDLQTGAGLSPSDARELVLNVAAKSIAWTYQNN